MLDLAKIADLVYVSACAASVPLHLVDPPFWPLQPQGTWGTRGTSNLSLLRGAALDRCLLRLRAGNLRVHQYSPSARDSETSILSSVQFRTLKRCAYRFDEVHRRVKSMAGSRGKSYQKPIECA